MNHEYTHKIIDKETGELLRLCRIESGRVHTPLTDRYGFEPYTWQEWLTNGCHIIPRLVTQ